MRFRLSLLSIILIFSSYLLARQTYAQCSSPVTYTNTGLQTFFVPAGVTSITIETWGAGGRGSTRISQTGRGSGGGGGAYSRSTISVSPGEQLAVFVGAGSTTEQPGESSWVARTEFESDAIVLAVGGQSGLDDSGGNDPGAGGSAALGIGDIRFSGGNGISRGGGENGGGGSSAGTSANGNNATTARPSGATAPSGGGNGGAGGPDTGNTSAGLPGQQPGGGGGGGERRGSGGPGFGGAGGDGQVVISYSCPTNGGTIIDDGAISGETVIEFNSDGTWTSPEGLVEFEVLVIGGGGGGGRSLYGGGGGAGGVIPQSFIDINLGPNLGLPAGTSFDIRIGDGGAGSTDFNSQGQDGESSIFAVGDPNFEIIAGGGGGGGSGTTTSDDGRDGVGPGASGGGARQDGNIGDAFDGSGNDGGEGNIQTALFGSSGTGGGGGGAGSAGVAGSIVGGNFFFPGLSNGGNGGNGLTVSGFPGVYGGGGGGNATDNPGSGGSGIGGNGNNNGTGGNGATNTGSGGGAGNVRGGNGGSGKVLIKYLNTRILPVEYLYINAEYNAPLRSGELSWATAKEWENDRFEIERSINNVTEWRKIGDVNGAGYSDAPVEYYFRDSELPVAGGNIFYRLKQVDFDGTYTYSKTTAIQVEGLKGNKSWRVYPNPTSGYPFQIGLLDPSSYRDEPISLRIISPTGLYHFIQVNDLRSMGSQVGDWLSNQPSGLYTLEIIWGENREYHKVILRR